MNKFPVKIRGLPSPQANHLVKRLASIARAEGISRRELARRAGIPERTLADWWYGVNPSLRAIEDVFGVFDLGLKPTPLEPKR